MLAMLLATVALVAACFVLGQAAVGLCGWSRPQWWAPAVGYALLMIIFGQAVQHRTHQTALLVLAIVLVLASLLLPFVRRSLREAAVDGGVLGIVLLLLAAIPFFAAGYAGILGPGLSNDMSQHLTAAWWLRHDTYPLPVAAIGGNLINTGYPLGPHALTAALSSLGLGEVRGFSTITLAVPVLTGFVALGIVPEARRGARWAFAAAIALGYLPAAFLAQGQFKELILAMLVLATAVALGDMARGDERLGWRTAIPVALLAGGGIYAYSYGAFLFIAFVALFVLAGEVLRRRELFSVVRRWWRAAVGAIIAAAVVIYPEIDRIQDFRDSIFGQESLRNKGNLAHALSPFETLGVWFNGDFRFNPDPRWPTIVFVVIALAALVASLVWWWRRRSLALPAAVAGAILVWVQLTQTVNIYNAAKGLMVLAPLVMACLGAPLALAWSAHGRGMWLARAVGVVLFLGAVISSGGILRSAPVGLGSHDQDFAAIREVVRDKPVVFINNDHFGEWELRDGRPLYTTNTLYAPRWLKQSHWKSSRLPLDVDYYDSPELDKVDYLVVEGGHYRSETPPNFRLALRTPSYEVYRRVGTTPVRQPIEAPGEPGTVFDCHDGFAPQRLKDFKWAGVMPRPIVSTNWKGGIARPGDTARMTIKLPRGRWDVSIQYVSTTPLTFKAPGVKNKLAPNFGLITNYWPAGTVTSSGQPITMTLTKDQRTWFAKLLGQPRGTRTALSPGNNPLFHWAFTRHGQGTQRVPIRQACGRYVDWLAPADSAMRGRRDER